MRVCVDCFADEEIRSAARSVSHDEGTCDICHRAGYLVDTSEFYDFYDELLRLFVRRANSVRNVADIIQDEWHLFRDKFTAETILDDIIRNGDYGYSIGDNVGYCDELISRISIWERLKNSVKEQSRFFTSIDEFEAFQYLSTGEVLSMGRKLYRARVIPPGQKTLKRKEMGCPPKELATAGRANPLGIPYLYLCDSPRTTYYEVRSLYLDRLSVGTFKVVREQKIVDFIFDINLYMAFSEGLPLFDIIVKKKVIDSISADLSKPLRRYDSELEYVPTQMICEYCKTSSSIAADGISFRSSLFKDGRNYVLFDPTAAKCCNVEVHDITKIEIDRF